MIRVPSNFVSYRIWENGFGLLTYLIAGAAPELSEKYQAACDSAFDGTQSESDPLTDLNSVLQEAQRYGHIETLCLEHKGYLVVDHPLGHWSSHRSLYRLLRSDVLVGFGFIEPRKPDDAPKPLPPDLWDGLVDWEASTVSGNGLSFAGVRIVSNRLIDRVIAEPAASKPSKPVGRPSVGQRNFE